MAKQCLGRLAFVEIVLGAIKESEQNIDFGVRNRLPKLVTPQWRTAQLLCRVLTLALRIHVMVVAVFTILGYRVRLGSFFVVCPCNEHPEYLFTSHCRSHDNRI
jgi:hypothetical protein